MEQNTSEQLSDLHLLFDLSPTDSIWLLFNISGLT